MERVIRSAIVGALAGAARTLAMDLVWYRRYRSGGGTQSFAAWETSEGTDGFDSAAAPARAAKAMADMIGIDLPESTARSVNNVVHWGTGIGWGQVHGVAAATLETASPLLGPVTAVAAWATSYAVLPLLGVYRPMREYSRDELWQDLSAHLAFGAVLRLAYRVIRGGHAD